MIAKDELDKAVEAAKKYGAGKLYLIGSSLREDPAEAKDYDFAVSGLPAGKFFRFYGELLRVMSKNVDLIDLSGKRTRLKDVIIREGKLVYDKRST